MAKRKKPKIVYEGYSPSDEYYAQGVLKANAYHEAERELAERRRAENADTVGRAEQHETTAKTRLHLWIYELISGLNKGATAWDVIKCLPRREIKPEDVVPEYSNAELMRNRTRAESSISSTLSHLHNEGILRWRNEGLLKDEHGKPVSGGEKRMGGYGVLRRVYEATPRELWKETAKKNAAKKDADRARREFIRSGMAIIERLTNENTTLRNEQKIIRQTGLIPDYLLLPIKSGGAA